jgi:putative ABC transport system permease protein
MLLVGMGTLCGLLVSVAVTRLIGSLLFEVSPLDAQVLLGVSALIAGCGLAASYLPARRATRVDPIVALRFE